MIAGKNHITVFEHETLKLNQNFEDGVFDELKLKALQQFYGEKGVPYYSLIHNGVKFCEYVGALQVGDLTIEVLPKADRNEDKAHWRTMLLDMLRSVGVFSIHAPSFSDLRIKPNYILELYFELYLVEVEYLLHQGLVKKYRKEEGNKLSLKGSIDFAKQINFNLIHKERFYTKHNLYDAKHQLHQLLYKTTLLLHSINTSAKLSGRIGAMLLNFPEQADIKVSESLFEKIQFDRKTERYRTAIAISKLLLLNYHPDVITGKNNVLALMFDMNALWEQFVYVSLYKHRKEGNTVSPQQTKSFWKPNKGNRVSMRPDIVINKGKENCAVIDTKWKNLGSYNPTPDDLRQMYVYHDYFNANKVALVYPGRDNTRQGLYFDRNGDKSDKECSVIPLSLETNITAWQKSIHDECYAWLNKKVETQ